MTKKLTLTALLAAMALGIYVLEAQLPPLTAIPGVKLGLANCMTLAALYLLGRREAAGVLAVRIVLAAAFSGQMLSFLFSLGGGIACFLVMALLCRTFSERQIWIVSVFGALAHNAGQLIVASMVMRTPMGFAWAPHLVIAAVLAGTVTGLSTQFAYLRIKNHVNRG